MTTKTDNYRELVQNLRKHAADIDQESFRERIEAADAIATLIKERDALAGDKCICGHSKGLHPTTPHRDGRCERGGCVCLKYMRDDVFADRDHLARENERLREQIEEVRAIIATARGRQYLGEITVDVLLKHHSQDVKAIDATLANAPTPNDKLDWDSCQHEWRARVDSQYHSETNLDVVCTKCQCPGDQNVKTGEVFWPAT